MTSKELEEWRRENSYILLKLIWAKEKDINEEAERWLEEIGQIEKRGNRVFMSEYANGYIDGIEFALNNIALKETR